MGRAFHVFVVACCLDRVGARSRPTRVSLCSRNLVARLASDPTTGARSRAWVRSLCVCRGLIVKMASGFLRLQYARLRPLHNPPPPHLPIFQSPLRFLSVLAICCREALESDF